MNESGGLEWLIGFVATGVGILAGMLGIRFRLRSERKETEAAVSGEAKRREGVERRAEDHERRIVALEVGLTKVSDRLDGLREANTKEHHQLQVEMRDHVTKTIGDKDAADRASRKELYEKVDKLTTSLARIEGALNKEKAA